MSDSATDTEFRGSIAGLYESYLVPLLFEPYAVELVKRLTSRDLSHITDLLEIAAGTGVVTRAMAAALPDSISIVATDLNQAMLDQAFMIGTSRPIEWRSADAMQLPFANASFDAVICQFGAMFFPDKVKAFSEIRRVLRPGGLFLFTIWDRIKENEFADVVTTALESVFPQDPPRFLARTPHGYYDLQTIQQDLASGGFTQVAEMETVAARSVAATSRDVAIGYCQGSPLRNEIEARKAPSLDEVTDITTEAIAERFGREKPEGKISAHIIAIKN